MGLPYDLRIGVTGHRAVADPAAIRTAVERLLDQVASTLSRPDAPLACTVVSPLAQGADRLVARAAMERLHARLEVVTPFPMAEYRTDFDSPADRDEFDALLAHAQVIDELPGIGVAEAPTLSADARRDAAYHRVGERVVDACEILIAIWNGRRAAGLGGTADIIDHALRHDRVVLWVDAERPDAPARLVRHVSYAAAEGDRATVAADDVPASARALSPGFHQQASYFADRSADDDTVRQGAAAVSASLADAAATAGIPIEAIAGIVECLVPEFVRADALALRYQRRHVWVVNGILRLAGGAVTVALAQVLFFPDELWLILFEVLAMLAVFGLWLGSRRGAWHEKWLHDRYLAEHLRAAMFTAMVGHTERASDDSTLGFYRGPKQWLTDIGDRLEGMAQSRVPPIPLEPLQRLLIEGWLRDQQAFHTRNAARKADQAHGRHLLGYGLFGATLLMALLHMLGVGHGESHGPLILDPSRWITFLALVLPVWAGTVHAITAQLELERVAERSGRMASALAGLAQRASHALTRDELAETARQASALMLRETREWWVLLSFQDTRLHV
ncbi:MAG: hypothetical protein AB7P99_19470 [Vicinamibacterales bacterium]